jgi:hypothetical protein
MVRHRNLARTMRVKKVGTVLADDGSGSNVFWVSVAPDGSLTTAQGVPVWWTGVAEDC